MRHPRVTRSRRPVVAAALCAALLGAAATDASAGSNANGPLGWQGAAQLIELPDLNPDPRIVEIALEARLAPVEIAPGQHAEAWTYNGMLPGPLIRARVGDRLIVRCTNQLPQPTTVHWHGVRVPIEMDGVPGVSQPPVKTGESFTYDFIVPDAALYWYHPHVMSAAQVGFGLYGALLVEDPSEVVSGLDQVVMVLSDIEVDAKGKLEDPDSGGSTGMAFGREGNRLLVNGRELPTLRARAGVPLRLRIVNAAKSRYFELDPDGPRFITVGGDGGLQEASVESSTLVIAPGERIDAIFLPGAKTGNELMVDWRLFNRGYGSVEARIPLGPLFKIVLDGNAGAQDAVPQDTAAQEAFAKAAAATLRRTVPPIDTAGAKDVRVDLTIDQRADGAFEYGINGVPFQKDKPFTAKLGETQIWNLVNETSWSHPFHLHGFFFQVLDENGAPVKPLVWKDTVDVPFKSSRRIVVRFDEDRPGAWMFHCHVLDHADGGLMGTVIVGDVPVDAPLHHH
jgi:FtsP/CotA-like multicopper oxidase with cupredoxin domain